jgi:hypothetical protein
LKKVFFVSLIGVVVLCFSMIPLYSLCLAGSLGFTMIPCFFSGDQNAYFCNPDNLLALCLIWVTIPVVGIFLYGSKTILLKVRDKFVLRLIDIQRVSSQKKSISNLTIRNGCLAISFACVFITHFDGIFFGASLIPSNYSGVLAEEGYHQHVETLPERQGRRVTDGQFDLGAAAWQMEPMRYFMRRCILEGESPYWNPYSATGSLGPETLVDVKFSVITIAAALLPFGGYSHQITLLGLLFISSFCLAYLLRRHLVLSYPAVVVGVFCFLNNGFIQTTLMTQMGTPFLLFPVVLLACLSFLSDQRRTSFLAMVFAWSILYSHTFLPSVLLISTFVFLISLAYLVSGPSSRCFRMFPMFCIGPVFGIALLAFMYLPIVESFKYVSLVEEYGRRSIAGIEVKNFISFITPKHFWESYNAFDRYRDMLHSKSLVEYVCHVGVLPFVLVSLGCFGWKHSKRNIVGFCVVFAVFCLLRVFGYIPLFDQMPGFRYIHLHYWYQGVCVAAIFLATIGFDIFYKNEYRVRGPMMLFLSVVLLSVYLAAGEVLLRSIEFRYVIVLFLLVLCGIAFLAFGKLRIWDKSREYLAIGFISLVVLEGLYYINHAKPIIEDTYASSSVVLDYLKETDREDGLPVRLINFTRKGLYPEWGSALEISQVGSLNSSELPWYKEFYRSRFGEERGFKFMAFGSNRVKVLNFEELSFIVSGVEYAMVGLNDTDVLLRLGDSGFVEYARDRHRILLRNPNAVQRTWFASQISLGDGYQNHDLNSVYNIVETDDRDFFESVKAAQSEVRGSMEEVVCDDASFSEYLEVIHFSNAKVEIKGRTEFSGVLVFADAWHPNWSATVNGISTKVAKVNGAFRGIKVDPGEYHIVMKYRPKTLTAGIVISSLTLFALAMLLVLGVHKTRKTQFRAKVADGVRENS